MHNDQIAKKFEVVYYAYHIPGLGLFESTTIIADLEFASIKLVEEELKSQISLMKFNMDYG